MKKGFTVVEMVAVITIIALICLLAFPSISNRIKKAKEDISEVDFKLIVTASDLYIDEHNDNYPKKDKDVYCIAIQDLVSDGKLSSDVLSTSNNKYTLTDYVKTTINGKETNYEIVKTCEENR